MTDGSDEVDAAAEAAGSSVPDVAPAPADDGPTAHAAAAANDNTHAQSLELTTVVPLALEVGWTMAVLDGHLRADADEPKDRLPTEHELGQSNRRALEIDRLECSLKGLSSAIPVDAHEIPDLVDNLRAPPAAADGGDPFTEALRAANTVLLSALACAGRSVELAYEVGRSLRDTVCPPGVQPNDPGSFEAAAKQQLSRERTAKLTQWISSLNPYLPANSGQVVSTSLGRWSTFAITVFDDAAPGALKTRAAANTKATIATKSETALLDQGDVWLGILTGAESTVGLLTPEANVAAGEAALSRTVRIVRRVVVHYWLALLVLAVALAAILYVSARYMGGAAKVWTQIAAIAGSLGVSARGIGSAVGHLSEAAERPIYRSEQLDAVAWAVTTLPKVHLNNKGVRVLRQAGIRPSQPLGRS